MRIRETKAFAAGRYFVERELGKGVVGVGFQALDQERKMRVALKRLHHLDENSLYTPKTNFAVYTIWSIPTFVRLWN